LLHATDGEASTTNVLDFHWLDVHWDAPVMTGRNPEIAHLTGSEALLHTGWHGSGQGERGPGHCRAMEPRVSRPALRTLPAIAGRVVALDARRQPSPVVLPR